MSRRPTRWIREPSSARTSETLKEKLKGLKDEQAMLGEQIADVHAQIKASQGEQREIFDDWKSGQGVLVFEGGEPVGDGEQVELDDIDQAKALISSKLKDLKAEVQEVDDVDVIRRAIDLEGERSKPRSGAMKALEGRLGELLDREALGNDPSDGEVITIERAGLDPTSVDWPDPEPQGAA